MSDNWVVIERTFAAPVATVWQMWTDAEHFKKWYGPKGASIPVANMDLVVGGKRHICMEMQTPNGPMKMWFMGEFKEISPINKLVYTDGMADEDGNMIPASAMGMPEGTPDSTDVVVELWKTEDGTLMKMTHVGVAADSPGAGGWAMAFDKLADCLGK